METKVPTRLLLVIFYIFLFSLSLKLWASGKFVG
ncbi:hypothetical protein Desde_0352 [Desulfitobacterium dehalogenans ATCC 51507]|uniref:Uncharacterized protein n=1 Tax=Desulfitobacterium dehalogenans (strain ATCC 51507 / DSM 9161 / JW/IU-DC1) TaxID=756499 RepID=I4A4D6_DESDJ|nr:hypothetical protein Desde_0352 [Desulfitobacterium dehalogenans ATCC 51507]